MPAGPRVLVPPRKLDRSFPDGANSSWVYHFFPSLILLSFKNSYSFIRAHRHRSVNFDSLTYKHRCRCRQTLRAFINLFYSLIFNMRQRARGELKVRGYVWPPLHPVSSQIQIRVCEIIKVMYNGL